MRLLLQLLLVCTLKFTLHQHSHSHYSLPFFLLSLSLSRFLSLSLFRRWMNSMASILLLLTTQWITIWSTITPTPSRLRLPVLATGYRCLDPTGCCPVLCRLWCPMPLPWWLRFKEEERKRRFPVQPEPKSLPILSILSFSKLTSIAKRCGTRLFFFSLVLDSPFGWWENVQTVFKEKERERRNSW